MSPLPATGREETGPDAELTGLLYARLIECDYGHRDVAWLPTAVCTAEPVGGTLRANGTTPPDGRDEIADVGWFEPPDLPADTLDREWLLAHWRGDGRP